MFRWRWWCRRQCCSSHSHKSVQGPWHGVLFCLTGLNCPPTTPSSAVTHCTVMMRTMQQCTVLCAMFCTAQCSRYWLGVALNRASWDISQIITFDGPFPKIFVFTRSNKSKVEKTSFSWSSNSNFAIWRIICSSSSYKRIISSCSIYLEYLKILL